LLSPEAEEKSMVQHTDQSTSSANDGPLIYLVFFQSFIKATNECYVSGENKDSDIEKILHDVTSPDISQPVETVVDYSNQGLCTR